MITIESIEPNRYRATDTVTGLIAEAKSEPEALHALRDEASALLAAYHYHKAVKALSGLPAESVRAILFAPSGALASAFSDLIMSTPDSAEDIAAFREADSGACLNGAGAKSWIGKFK